MDRSSIRSLFPIVHRNYLFSCIPGRVLPDTEQMSFENYRLIYPCPKRSLTPDMLAAIGLDQRSLDYRLEAGDNLGVILYEDRIAHRSLVQTRGFAAMEGDTRAIRLLPGQIYVHYCETVTDQRGRGLYSTMLKAIISATLNEANVNEILIACHQGNVSSIRGILRAGFTYKRSSIAISAFRGQLRYSYWYSEPVINFGSHNATQH